MQTVKIKGRSKKSLIDTGLYRIQIYGVLEQPFDWRDDPIEYTGETIVFYSFMQINRHKPWESTFSSIPEFLKRFDLKERK